MQNISFLQISRPMTNRGIILNWKELVLCVEPNKAFSSETMHKITMFFKKAILPELLENKMVPLIPAHKQNQLVNATLKTVTHWRGATVKKMSQESRRLGVTMMHAHFSGSYQVLKNEKD